MSVGVGDGVDVSVTGRVPVGDGDGRGEKVGNAVSVGVGDCSDVPVGGGVLVAAGVPVGGRRVAVVVGVGTAEVTATTDWVAVIMTCSVGCESGLMLRTRASPRHSKTSRAKPLPIALAIPKLRKARMFMVTPSPLL